MAAYAAAQCLTTLLEQVQLYQDRDPVLIDEQLKHLASIREKIIPSPFAKDCVSKVPSKVRVIARDNEIHKMEFTAFDEYICLSNGWVEFCTRYGVELKDEVVFYYNKGNVLFVDLFDKAGVLKDIPGAAAQRERCQKNLAERRRKLQVAKEQNEPSITPVNQIVPALPQSPNPDVENVAATRRNVTSKRKQAEQESRGIDIPPRALHFNESASDNLGKDDTAEASNASKQGRYETGSSNVFTYRPLRGLPLSMSSKNVDLPLVTAYNQTLTQDDTEETPMDATPTVDVQPPATCVAEPDVELGIVNEEPEIKPTQVSPTQVEHECVVTPTQPPPPNVETVPSEQMLAGEVQATIECGQQSRAVAENPFEGITSFRGETLIVKYTWPTKKPDSEEVGTYTGMLPVFNIPTTHCWFKVPEDDDYTFETVELPHAFAVANFGLGFSDFLLTIWGEKFWKVVLEVTDTKAEIMYGFNEFCTDNEVERGQSFTLVKTKRDKGRIWLVDLCEKQT